MSEYYEHIAQEWPLFTRYTGERIVRCRDCEYNAKDTDGICYRFDHEHFNQPDGFCAWAVKRTGAENG